VRFQSSLARSISEEFITLLDRAKEAVKLHVTPRPREGVFPALKAAAAAPLKRLRFSNADRSTSEAVEVLQAFCEDVEEKWGAENAREARFVLGVSEEMVGFARSRRLEVQVMFEEVLAWFEVQALVADAGRVFCEFEAAVKAQDPAWMSRGAQSIAVAVDSLDALRCVRDALDAFAQDGCQDAIQEKAKLPDKFKTQIDSLGKFVVNSRVEKLKAWLAEFVGDIRGQIDKKTLPFLESATFSDAEVFAMLHTSRSDYRMWREKLEQGVTAGLGVVRVMVRGFEEHEREIVSGMHRDLISYQEARRLQSRSEKLDRISNTISQILADKQFLRDKTRLAGCLAELQGLVGREHDTFRNTVQLVKRGIGQLQDSDHLNNLIAAENYNQLVETVVVLRALQEALLGFMDVDASNVHAQVKKFAKRILDGAMAEMEGSVRLEQLSEFKSLRLVSTLSPTLRNVFPDWIKLEKEVRDRGLTALWGNIDEVIMLMRSLKPEEEIEEGKLVSVARLLIKGFAVATQITCKGYDAVHPTP